MDRIYTTGNILRMFSIPQHKLYYWESMRRLPSAKRTESGKRFYTGDDLAILKKLIPELLKKSNNNRSGSSSEGSYSSQHS